jgi:hypothetical protein
MFFLSIIYIFIYINYVYSAQFQTKNEYNNRLLSLQTESKQKSDFSCNGSISIEEYDALYDLYISTNGTDWSWLINLPKLPNISIINTSNAYYDKTIWNFPSNLSSPCTDKWQGITCVNKPNYTSECIVKEIYLPATNLRGNISNSIANLTNLSLFNLNYNFITSSLPVELYTMTNLKTLSIRSNFLTGPLNPLLSNLINLEVLQFDNNYLSSTLPEELYTMTNLNILYLDNCRFSGYISQSISNLTSLVQLWINNNAFQGQLPHDIFYLTNLMALNLNTNNFTGSIPSIVGNLQNLLGIDFYHVCYIYIYIYIIIF